MRIVVLGAGYAGVTLARRLDARLSPEDELVVVDERPTHLVQHELHRLVRFPELEDVIQVHLDDLFDVATVRNARVESVDREERVVHLDDGELDYDFAAICLGAQTAFYDLPGLEAHAIPLKRIEDARAVRESFLDTCAAGETAVVGGAGLSGVQVAGELAALADEEGSDSRVVLLEQLDSVAPSFPENFQRAVRDALESAGVEVRTGTTVERATETAVETDDGRIPYGTLVWTGGIRGPDALDRTRPTVRSDLRLDEHTFVVGDAARAVDADGEAVPASASAALREARVVADNLLDLVDHAREADPDDFAPRLQQYRFEVPGWIVSVGDGTVAQIGPTVLQGGAARAMKATVGAGHLSMVGALRQASQLVEAELGPRAAPVEEIPEAVLDVDGIEVRDAADAVDELTGGVGTNRTARTEPIEIEIPVDDEESTGEAAGDADNADEAGKADDADEAGKADDADEAEDADDADETASS